MVEEELVKEVMTPKTHILGELKKYAVFAWGYLDKALGLHFRSPFRKWIFKTYIYKQKRLLRKLFRELQQKSHRGITSKLLLDLETGVILVIALYEDIAEGQSKK
jgi:hypothetical protein